MLPETQSMAWWFKEKLIFTKQPLLSDILWSQPSFKIFATQRLASQMVEFFFSFLFEMTAF